MFLFLSFLLTAKLSLHSSFLWFSWPTCVLSVEESWGCPRSPKSDWSIPAIDANWPSLTCSKKFPMKLWRFNIFRNSMASRHLIKRGINSNINHSVDSGKMWDQTDPASFSRSRNEWNFWKEDSMLSSTCSSSRTEALRWASDRDWFRLRKRSFSSSSCRKRHINIRSHNFNFWMLHLTSRITGDACTSTKRELVFSLLFLSSTSLRRHSSSSTCAWREELHCIGLYIYIYIQWHQAI